MKKFVQRVLLFYLILLVGALLGFAATFLSFPDALSADTATLLDWFPNFGRILSYGFRLGRIILMVFPLAALLWVWYLAKYNPKRAKDLLALVISVIFSLVILEIALRFLGFVPGFIGRQLFFHPEIKEVKPLVCFVTDESGILMADTTLRPFINKHLQDNAFATAPDSVCLEVYSLLPIYLQVKNGEVDSPIARLYQKIASKKEKTPFENLLVKFVNSPLNKHGFRSIPFDTRIPGKPRILLIGDSFTWGHHLSNISYSFYDRLLADGYLVYNSGISGADILQYEAVAKKYLPVIEPDIVIVNLFLGNDLEYYPRKFGPFVPLYYPTDAGNIYANQYGVYFDNREDAYKNVIKNIQINRDVAGYRIADKTVLTSMLWGIVHPNIIQREVLPAPAPLYRENLDNIVALCRENNIRPIIVSIPTQSGFVLKHASDYPDFFKGLQYFELADLGISDYVQNNGHFNQSGHEKYTVFLETLIDSGALYKPAKTD